MSKRLLAPEQALRKIELSLKLQGKSFKPEYLDCSNCKFYWGNIPGGRPQWSGAPWQYSLRTGQQLPAPTSPLPAQPEKYRWMCFKYKFDPQHAFLRFKVVRKNAEGKEIYAGWKWNPAPMNPGDTEELILMQPNTDWKYKVCRRFESAPRIGKNG